MQSVPFSCVHCGQLIAVGSEFLGQPVRCPHCQQIVTAPPMAPLTPSSEAEDIFSPHASDDLFGRTDPPRLEISLDPPAPTLPDEPTVPLPAAGPDAAFAATAPELPPGTVPQPPVNDESTANVPPADVHSPWTNAFAVVRTEPNGNPPANPDAPPSAGALAPTLLIPSPTQTPDAAAAPSLRKRSEAKTPWSTILLISPLVLYSLIVTIFAVMLYLHQRSIEQQRRNPFEMMPDDGDDPGTRKGEKKESHTYRYNPDLTTRPLPTHLRTPLGKPLQIGDLRLTPERVERKRVRVIVDGGFQPEPCLGDSLVLHLTMENLSEDRAFAPLDNYFDRYWERGHPLPPLTLLQAGRHYFYGGPARWYPRGMRSERREWVEGRKGSEADLLQPGESKKDHFFVCTDGNDAEARRVLFGEKKQESYQGTLLWRIRVRRGRVRVKDKIYSATAVVGVEFRASDIEAAPAGQPAPAE